MHHCAQALFVDKVFPPARVGFGVFPGTWTEHKSVQSRSADSDSDPYPFLSLSVSLSLSPSLPLSLSAKRRQPSCLTMASLEPFEQAPPLDTSNALATNQPVKQRTIDGVTIYFAPRANNTQQDLQPLLQRKRELEKQLHKLRLVQGYRSEQFAELPALSDRWTQLCEQLVADLLALAPDKTRKHLLFHYGLDRFLPAQPDGEEDDDDDEEEKSDGDHAHNAPTG
ncbi:uncharacterized protein MONBRDRAFT_29727 [Monosiga brevicollis MX1]|uniref:Meiosis protein 5 homolog n=1 Tax=Monosiga brevicollis TaxID=81824 RepID=A9VBY5_MONBE|nr:uncharacterized protein MONBRDRAFT_29727 [Monosiga brevicollis MX1]EDQ84886.1 predicted protein [Monosiga brevicollis MX1]|eukprot:XP_001750227.1 hypothetical protein [Monosiga brevicollis MX1]